MPAVFLQGYCCKKLLTDDQCDNKDQSLTFGTAASPRPSSRHAQDGVHLVFP